MNNDLYVTSSDESFYIFSVGEDDDRMNDRTDPKDRVFKWVEASPLSKIDHTPNFDLETFQFIWVGGVALLEKNLCSR